MSNGYNKVKCPKCGNEFELTEALISQISSQIRSDIEKQYFDKLHKLEEELQNKDKILNEKVKEKEVELEKYYEEKLRKERKELIDQLEKQADDKYKFQLEALEKRNKEIMQQLDEFRKNEILLRQEKQKLEEEKKNIELELMRQLDAERAKIKDELSKDFSLREAEYQKKLEDMKKALEEAQRKGEASSERFRGEILELEIEKALRETFIHDIIEEVPKGELGADIIQTVKTKTQKTIGKIVWEIKRTKNFNEDWIPKLKDDVMRVGGNIGIIVTQTMPSDIEYFGYKDGVWVCDFFHYIPLAHIIRVNIFEIQRVKDLNQDRDSKSNALYEYITSDQFRNRVISLLETYKQLSESLDREKKAFQKIWAEREKQIEKLYTNTIKVIGNMEGIVGPNFPKITSLDLPFEDDNKE